MKTSRWGRGSGPLDVNACHGEPISGSGIFDGALCLLRQHRRPQTGAMAVPIILPVIGRQR